eukprot:5289608-Pleurochrysis_carterae.AAC.3
MSQRLFTAGSSPRLRSVTLHERAQAFCSPAAYPMIADRFPPWRRATANAVYTSGLYLGYALASLSVLFSKAIGWRATCLAVAAVSAVRAPVRIHM